MRAVNLAGVLDGRILGFAWAKRNAQGAGRRAQGAGCRVQGAHTRRAGEDNVIGGGMSHGW